MTPRFFLGVDLGEEQNYTAMAVLEQKLAIRSKPRPRGMEGIIRPDDKLVTSYHLRHLERMALGTSYPVQVDNVYRTMKMPELQEETALIVDATGVGKPVVEWMKVLKGLSPISIVIHPGTELTVVPGGFHVPKRELVSALVLLYQSERIKYSPKIEFATELEKELQTFKRKATLKGHDVYGAWREGEYDDLVLAVAIAAWYATYIDPWERSIRSGKPKPKDWNPLAEDDEQEDVHPGLYNPMRYGGHN